jgi:hypothetical protein
MDALRFNTADSEHGDLPQAAKPVHREYAHSGYGRIVLVIEVARGCRPHTD